MSTTPIAASQSAAPTVQGISFDGRLYLNFSGPVSKGSGYLSLVDALTGILYLREAVDSDKVTVSGNTLVVTPGRALPPGVKFSLFVGGGAVKGSDGQPSAGSEHLVMTGLASWAQDVGGSNNADLLQGSEGNDVLRGMDGADVLIGSGGDDVLDGGDGNDRLYANGGNNLLLGGAGNDLLATSGSGDNRLLGGAGNDNLSSTGTGRNELDGGDGDDILQAGAGWDLLDGGNGNDRLYVGSYDAPGSHSGRVIKAIGGAGDDRLSVAMAGDDSVTVELSGGAGSDIFEVLNLRNAGAVVVTDFDAASGDRLSFASAVFQGGQAPSNVNPFVDGTLRLQQAGADTQVLARVDGIERVLMTLKNVAAASLTYGAFVEGFDPRAASGAVSVVGGAGNDRIAGGNYDDHLSGGDGNDSLHGLGGNDVLSGGAGDDYLDGGAGDDHLDGGAGRDVAAIHAKLGDVRMWWQDGAFHVQDQRGNAGHDTLVNVERISFSDSWLALDIDGGAGQLYRLYAAAFGRAPDAQGYGYWLAQADRGVSLGQIADNFVASQEFQALYGDLTQSAQLVSHLYQNALGRAPDAAGQAYWTEALRQGKLSVGQMLQGFSDSEENVAAMAQIIGNGIAYQHWF